MGRATTVQQPQQLSFRECQDVLGFSNIFGEFRGAEFQQSRASPYCPPEPLSASTVWGILVSVIEILNNSNGASRIRNHTNPRTNISSLLVRLWRYYVMCGEHAHAY